MREITQKIYEAAAALAGGVALIVQFYLLVFNSSGKGNSTIESVIVFFSFMTIQANLLVTLSFTLRFIARKSWLSHWFHSQTVMDALLIYISIVAMAYHFLLAQTWNPQGLQRVVDLLLHYIVPLAYIIYWIIFFRKEKVKFSFCIKMLLYPALYFIYILSRGAIMHEYPYPFIDVTTLGYSIVFRNAMLLCFAYFIGGVALWSVLLYFGKPHSVSDRNHLLKG